MRIKRGVRISEGQIIRAILYLTYLGKLTEQFKGKVRQIGCYETTSIFVH